MKNDKRLKELRESLRSAVAEMNEAGSAIDALADDASNEDIQASEERFDTAAAEVERRKENLDKAEARARALEDAPVIEPEAKEETPEVRVKSEPMTYQRGRYDNSYFSDLYRASLHNDRGAQERLQKHAQEVAEKRDLDSSPGDGGEFIPPLWMQNEWVNVARAGRPFANSVNGLPLPPGTDSINLPKLATGTATGVQTDNGSVADTDATTSSVTAAVQTIAGMQDVSRQAIDRSMPGLDEVLFADLAADYAEKLENALINGAVTNAKGVIQVSGVNTVTYTDESPTLPELYPKISDAIQQNVTDSKRPPNLIVMHPRRWYWMTSQLDDAKRPLISPVVPQNAMGLMERVGEEAIVGNIHGIPVLLSHAVPTTHDVGESETHDQIVVCRTDELWLYEDVVQTKMFESVGSGTLTVRLQVYGYYAFMSERRPDSIAVISGTGLDAPTF